MVYCCCFVHLQDKDLEENAASQPTTEEFITPFRTEVSSAEV